MARTQTSGPGFDRQRLSWYIYDNQGDAVRFKKLNVN